MRKLVELLNKPLDSSKIIAFLKDYELEKERFPDMEEYYLTAPLAGFEMIVDLDDRVQTIFISSGIDPETCRFEDCSDLGISFEWREEDIPNIVSLTFTHLPEASLRQRPFGMHLRYDFKEFSLVFEFDRDHLSKIVAMTARRRP